MAVSAKGVALVLAVAVAALAAGTAIGFVVGRSTLARRWDAPFELAPAAPADGDPAPAAGARVAKAMPIGRVRLALADVIAHDPVLVRSASVGASDDANELHVMVENRGSCTITKLAGVAYGFDPHGLPAKTNRDGSNRVAFEGDVVLPPGKKAVIARQLRYAAAATLAVAHVDTTTCSDGPAWRRP